MTDNFFNEPQAAAVLKHGILRRYLPVFATMTGSRAGEVTFVDGYAGPGLYDDGTPGSPALAMAVADQIEEFDGKATLRAHFVEKDAASVAALKELLKVRDDTCTLHQGSAESKIAEIIDSLDPATPLFAFIDPFGLPISFALMTRILERGGQVTRYGRRDGAPTEVLLNFSNSGINRVGGQLTGVGSDEKWLKARSTMIKNLDATLGGDWWQEIWRAGGEDRFDRILEGYKTALGEARPGIGVFDVPISDRWDGPAAYHLLLLTEHDDGVWRFNEALSSAMEEFRTFCEGPAVQLELESAADREARWVNTIAGNVTTILNGGSFRPVDRITEVFGDCFGYAREKHLRRALKQLLRDEIIVTDPKGVKRLGTLQIRPKVN